MDRKPDLAGDPPPPTKAEHLRHAILRHLPYFIVVAQEGHFRRAAAILNITQSALSRRIKALEQEIGAPLLQRTQRGATLTPPGAVLYEEARGILRSLERTVDRVHSAMRGDVGVLRAGMNEGAVRSPQVTAALRAYRERHPGVQLDLLPMLTEEQLVALANGELDVGFFYDLTRDDEFAANYESRLIKREPMVLAVPAEHRLAAKSQITVADLADERLIWPSREHGRHLYDRMIAAFQAAGHSPNIAMEVLTGEMTVNFTASGLGMGFVGRDQHAPATVVLREVGDFDVALDLQVAWRRDSESATRTALLELLQAQSARA